MKDSQLRPAAFQPVHPYSDEHQVFFGLGFAFLSNIDQQLDAGVLYVITCPRNLESNPPEAAMNRFKSLSLAFILILVPLAQMVPAHPQSSDVEKMAKVKSEIAKRIANKKTRVKIKLLKGGELKARIEQADDDSFTITQDKTGQKIELAYSEVDGVKGRGGLSTGAKIGIILGVAVVVVAIAVLVSLKNFDPFSGGITVR
jgi:tetrahydromethanopterin S-methyltransferase subunit G